MFNTYEANATVSLIAWFSYHTRHQIQHAQSHMETETMIILWAVSHKRYPHISDVFSTGWAALLLTHTSVNDSFNQTLTRSTHHAISQHIPFVFDGSLLRENQLCHAPDQRKKESRAGLSEMLVWLLSHNRKHLRPVEQMLGEDLRPGAINQALSAADQAPCNDNTTWQILLLTHL